MASGLAGDAARLCTSPSRTIQADLAIGAYGEQYQGISIDTMYTGVGQIVEANDLRTFPARNLSTVEGRWMSPDPAGLSAVDLGNPQSSNRYAYVVGNPFGLVDPSGMDAMTGSSITTSADCRANLTLCKTVNIQLWEYQQYLYSGAVNVPPNEFSLLQAANSPIGYGRDGDLLYPVYGNPGVIASNPVQTIKPVTTESGNVVAPSKGTPKPTTPTLVCYQGGCIMPGGPPLPKPTCGGLKKTGAAMGVAGQTARVGALIPSPASPALATGGTITSWLGAIVGALGLFGVGCTP